MVSLRVCHRSTHSPWWANISSQWLTSSPMESIQSLHFVAEPEAGPRCRPPINVSLILFHRVISNTCSLLKSSTLRFSKVNFSSQVGLKLDLTISFFLFPSRLMSGRRCNITVESTWCLESSAWWRMTCSVPFLSVSSLCKESFVETFSCTPFPSSSCSSVWIH